LIVLLRNFVIVEVDDSHSHTGEIGAPPQRDIAQLRSSLEL